jgi:hydroxypyruvate reductase
MDAVLAAALRAADPAEAVRRHASRSGRRLRIDGQDWDLEACDEVVLIAVGKASVPMAAAALDLAGDRVRRGAVVTKHGHLGDPPPAFAGRGLAVIEAGHPVPDERSLEAGQAVCGLLSGCTERTLVLACISGGASALLAAPQPGISLGTLRAINDALLRSGADIREMNAVRSRLDRLKGGGLARLAAPAQVVALILSDVVGDPLEVIASGLTHDPRARNVLVGNNTQACEAAAAAARALGVDARIVTTELRGEARERGAEIARDLARAIASPQAGAASGQGACLVYGGETTVTLRGDGKGGRNQELALAAAIELAALDPRRRAGMVVASVGTDGTDGPTDAAGAVAYADTLERARALGLEAGEFLARNDSYRFFEALGDLVMTGPTGTNVADVVVALHPG